MVSKKDCRRRNMQNWLTVLKRLLDWLLQNREPEAVFLWLYRDAGAGKPSIIQTFTTQCVQSSERHLLASFFFWRDDPRRSSHVALMATLIHEAVTVVAALRPFVAAAMEQDSSILEKHLKHQIMSLLVEPINSLVSDSDFKRSSIPSLILIDGLDECSGTNNQCSILKAFAETLPHCHHTLRILITSRGNRNQGGVQLGPSSPPLCVSCPRHLIQTR